MSTFEKWMWFLSIAIPLAIFFFGLWWKIEAKQSEKIDKLAETNNAAHNEIHTKIDEINEISAKRHSHVRDKIEAIWQHLVKHKD